ncbi:hypothetical protein [Pseudaestuariivita atlantica]|uniref:Tetratricopeptide repeat protein n=1 Tax=Pseudaestuariivita atlantica TaxID=1317121 RepID=A0A0L1JMP7_9RHOB|nr:hypothetical protein [Pseudaestuariivita atlantica]KNG93024.1 hypothetical protein ATO11_13960 [Pseudaestuariivita atlantica]
MDYFDLGTHGRAVSDVPEAQTWFDRGLVWTYGYNHEEAIACFERALAADPGCAMSLWGIAYAVGPNYNKVWEDFGPAERPAMLQTANDALDRAEAMQADAPTAALIAALRQRYPRDVPEDYAPFHAAYARAMAGCLDAYPHDLDIICLYAEAEMNRAPWALWDWRTGAPSDVADTRRVQATLESAFERPEAWDHPGLLHMYVHLMEQSATPERALRHGDRLATVVPASGHLIHMGTHIDVQCGDYHTTVARNLAAIVQDDLYRDYAGSEGFYMLYCLHNMSFTLYGAMFLGQKRIALEMGDRLIGAMSRSFLDTYADWFEAFAAKKQHAMVRFGMWEEILEQPFPEDIALYAQTHAAQRYARAVALANTGAAAAARNEAAAFEAARDAVPEARVLFNNSCADLNTIATEVMWGEILYHEGAYDAAFTRLRRAVELDDALHYDEPWGWMMPTRHPLGALLAEQGHWAEAEAVFRADLGLDGTLPRACQHPGNIWALKGLDECLEARGEEVERRHIRAQLAQATARADAGIAAACFCRSR